MTGTTQHSSATPQDTTSTGTADPDATPASAMGLVDVDPAELLVHRNVRTGPTEPGRSGSSAATRTLVASIREHGVLVPIVAVRLRTGSSGSGWATVGPWPQSRSGWAASRS